MLPEAGFEFVSRIGHSSVVQGWTLQNENIALLLFLGRSLSTALITLSSPLSANSSPFLWF